MPKAFSMRIKPSEFQKIQKKFNRIVTGTRDKVVKTAVRKAAKPVLNDMRSRAPKSPDGGGSLRKSIKLKVRGYKRNGFVVGMVGVSRTKYQARGKMIQPSKYAHLVEYGTKAHGPKKAAFMVSSQGAFFGRKVSGVAPRPFVRPAFDSKKSGMENDTRRLIGAGIKTLARIKSI